MPDAPAHALMRSVRPRVVLRSLAQLLIALAVLTLVPALVSLGAGAQELGLRLIELILVLLLVFVPLSFLPEPRYVQRNEALCITALVFLIVPLLMSYALRAEGLFWLDAWFEAVSAITTTGLSTLSSVESHSRAFLFTRAWMQWYGGLGIAVLAVALLMGHQVASRKLLQPSGEEGASSTARSYARQVLLVYSSLTLFGFVLIWLTHHDGFEALIHALAAVSTGGFSGFDNSLESLSIAPQLAITLLSLAGAIGLPLYFVALSKRQPRRLLEEETRALLLAVLLLTLLFTAYLLISGRFNASDAFGNALVLAVSAQSTTGFTSLDLTSLDPGLMLVLILSMLVGGSAGSTAGGFKLIRLLILFQVIRVALQRINAPSRAVLSPRLGREVIDAEDIGSVLVLLGLWFLVVMLSWWVFLLYGEPPLNALFEVVSAVSTVGLSSGVVRPELAPALKVVLCIDMLLGRVEIVALLVLFLPRTWIGRRHD
ncbi:TrkH family potassium uptake protein [Marinobacterium lutimaris]|uniref:Trk system potassium uptake protein TrkH n=1 Tax=Marinobacterium lutimaris TaxID=568106 RepID=A0A1H6C961_9GAMM|nr:potassium transporter TrkG [Marinobacterium lutimaris]SEG69510.1 trk system potassium uptake protein TrkH [Marinobacterium lutimaris]